MKKIEFTLVYPELEYCAEFPSPAINNIPEWYKKMPSFSNNKKSMNEHGLLNETIKKCIPIFDSISTGYTIKLWTDVLIEKNTNGTAVHTSTINSGVKAVEGHSFEQVTLYPFKETYEKNIFKWINPWKIKTPKGYSCFFTNPIHNDLPFNILDGLVDTDTYPQAINFPFLLENKFSGLIKRGTPIAQVIPFKRESFSSIKGEFDREEYNKLKNFHDTSFTNKYKLKWWSRKKYT